MSLKFIYFLQQVFFDPFGQCNVEDHSIVEDENFKIDIRVYKPSQNPDRTLMVMPPTGGVNSLDVGYSYYFCKRGYKVILVKGWTKAKLQNTYDNLGVHQIFMERAIKAVHAVANYVKKEELYALGTSAGAIQLLTALNYGNFSKRLKKIFVVVGGTPLLEVLTSSDEKELKKARDYRFKKFGFESLKDYREALSPFLDLKAIETKPKELEFAMVKALKDKTVPTDFQSHLEESLRPSKVIKIDSNHFRTIFKTYIFHKKEIYKFFSTKEMEKKND